MRRHARLRLRLATLAALGMLTLVRPAWAEPDAAAEDPMPATGSVEPDDAAELADLPRPDFSRPAAKPLTTADLPPSSVFARRFTRLLALPAGPMRAGIRDEYRAIIGREASAAGVPAELVNAVMAVESGFNPATIGADGEIGLMQVMPATARMLGFDGTDAELAVPEINIHYGVMYLAGAWHRAGQDICTTTMKYRAGHGETRFSFRSVNYCIRVRAHLASLGYPVTGTVPEPTFGEPASAGIRARSLTTAGAGRIDFQALNARLRASTATMVVRAIP